MRIRHRSFTHRPVAVTCTVAALLLALATPALPTPPAEAAVPAQLTTSVAAVPAGTQLAVAGSGFAAGETVDLAVGTAMVGSVVTDSTGSFRGAAVIVPAGTQPGTIALTATGRVSRITVQHQVVIKSERRQLAYDGADSYDNPYENTLTTSTVTALRRSWTVADWDLGPVADGYVATDSPFGASLRRVGTGVVARKFVGNQSDTGWIAGSLAISRGAYSLNASNVYTGGHAWSATLNGTSVMEVGGPLVGTSLYLFEADRVRAFDTARGTAEWNRPVGTAARALIGDSSGITYLSGAYEHPASTPLTVTHVSLAGDLLWSTVVTSGYSPGLTAAGTGVVFLTTDDAVVGLDEQTGRQLWAHPVTSVDQLGSADGMVLIEAGAGTAAGSSVVALDARTGTRRWSAPLSGRFAAAGSLLYSDGSDAITATALATGQKIADVPLGTPGDPLSLEISDGVLYASYTVPGDTSENASQVAAFALPYVAPSLLILDDTAAQLSYGPGWQVASAAGDFRGAEHRSAIAGSTLTFRFTGTGFRYWYGIGTDRGIAGVSVDGGAETRIDAYAASGRNGSTAWTSPRLTAGSHTVSIRVTGSKNPASSSPLISVDRIELGRN